ncbi:hypothetical protein GGF50DRAFT_119918 [Schizophyllum commune]
MAASTIQELDRLADLILATEEALGADASTSVDTHISKIVRTLSERRPLQKLFAAEPPLDQPYATFGRSGAGEKRLVSLRTAISCLTSLCRLAKSLGRPGLFPFDADFLLSVFAWVDYLLPIGREAALQDLPPARQAWHILSFTRTCLSFLESFIQNLSKERICDVLLSGEERFTAILVQVWMHLPQTLEREGAMQDESAQRIALISRALLPDFCVKVDDELLREHLVAEITRVVHHRPRRYFRVYTSCIRYSLARPITMDERAYFGNLLFALFRHCHVPDFGSPGRMPTGLVSALIDVIYPPHFPARYGVDTLVWCCLPELVSRSTRTLRHAIEHDFFSCLFHVTRTVKDVAVPPALYSALQEISKKPGVVRAFQTALLAFEANRPSEKYPEEVQAVIDAFKRQADFLRGSAELWDSMAICSNAECPNSDDDAPLRACVCGEALYCSRECQRAHWYDGMHKHECPSYDDELNEHGTLSAACVIQMVWRAKYVVEGYCKAAIANPAVLKLPLYVTLEWRDQPEKHLQIHVREDHEIPEECISTPQPIIVDYSFDQGGEMRERRLEFFLGGLAGRIRMPFRLLTQAFIYPEGADTPPCLPDLTKRERLFGRQGICEPLEYHDYATSVYTSEGEWTTEESV